MEGPDKVGSANVGSANKVGSAGNAQRRARHIRFGAVLQAAHGNLEAGNAFEPGHRRGIAGADGLDEGEQLGA